MKITSTQATRASWHSTCILAFTPGVTGSCQDGVEYIPGEYRSLTGDLVGVNLQGANVLEDDGELLDAFLHDPSEFSDEYAILFGDLDLDLDLYLT